jgi:hypothetical protein
MWLQNLQLVAARHAPLTPCDLLSPSLDLPFPSPPLTSSSQVSPFLACEISGHGNKSAMCRTNCELMRLLGFLQRTFAIVILSQLQSLQELLPEDSLAPPRTTLHPITSHCAVSGAGALVFWGRREAK